MNDRVTTATTHAAAWWSAIFGVFSFHEVAILLGLVLSFASFLLSWYYKRANHKAVVAMTRSGKVDQAAVMGDLHEKVNR